MPDGLALDTALVVFQAGALARGLLSAMRLDAGDTVLITAAAGRVGSLLVQWAKAAGATVIGAASGAKLDAVTGFGADHAVDYDAAGWAEEVRELTFGRGATLDIQAIARRGLTLCGPLGMVIRKSDAEQQDDAEQALAAAGRGELRPRIHGRFPLDQAVGAHRELEERRSVGAVVLTI